MANLLWLLAALAGSVDASKIAGISATDLEVFSFCKFSSSCFLRGSVIPFPIGFSYRQVAILLWLLGITIIISPPYH
jgi:hypothetical protein